MRMAGRSCAPAGSRRGGAGRGVEGVEIRSIAGAEPHRVPVSLFGQGTITFHIEGIFRTPPGWNFWVSGPPNQPKDGIAPLGADRDRLVALHVHDELALHPARSLDPVRGGEPICFFFPVQRDAAPGMAPQ